MIKFVADLQQSRWRDEAGADIAEGIEKIPRFDAGRDLDRLLREQIPVPVRMRRQHKNHGNRLDTQMQYRTPPGFSRFSPVCGPEKVACKSLVPKVLA